MKVGKGTKRKRGTAAVITDIQTAIEDVVTEESDELTPEEEQVAEVLDEEALETPIDDGQQVHDNKVVQTLKVRAVTEMARRGIHISPAENKTAVGIFPKVDTTLLSVTVLPS